MLIVITIVNVVSLVAILASFVQLARREERAWKTQLDAFRSRVNAIQRQDRVLKQELEESLSSADAKRPVEDVLEELLAKRESLFPVRPEHGGHWTRDELESWARAELRRAKADLRSETRSRAWTIGAIATGAMALLNLGAFLGL